MAELVTRELRLDAPSLETVYLGGGTPSKLGGEGVARLLERIAQAADVENLSTSSGRREITLEANPEDVTPGAAEAWARAGVNRVSLGVQSFEPRVLDWMHRGHGPDAASAAVQVLRSAGIVDLSVDLIFALPSTLARDWGRDLERALELRPSHLSLYGLTVEPHTPLGKWTARGEVAEAPEERYADEFLEANERLAGAGFTHYEVSNFALPGHEAQHNSAYWSGAPYLGLGPSAHGFDGTVRRWNADAYAEWSARVGAGRDPIEGHETIGREERSAEEVYLGLRTTAGLAIQQNEITMVNKWIEQGWGVLTGSRLALTPTGWLRLDAIAAVLTSARSHS